MTTPKLIGIANATALIDREINKENLEYITGFTTAIIIQLEHKLLEAISKGNYPSGLLKVSLIAETGTEQNFIDHPNSTLENLGDLNEKAENR